MKRSRKGWPDNVPSAKHATFNVAAIDRALRSVPTAAGESAALIFWRDKLWQAADSVRLKLTDQQLEAMAADLVVAAQSAPTDE